MVGNNRYGFDSQPSRKDSLSGTADLLKLLADVPSVSGHEQNVRDAIESALPAWAQIARTH